MKVSVSHLTQILLCVGYWPSSLHSCFMWRLLYSLYATIQICVDLCWCWTDIVDLCEVDASLCGDNASHHMPAEPDLDHLDIGSFVFR